MCLAVGRTDPENHLGFMFVGCICLAVGRTDRENHVRFIFVGFICLAVGRTVCPRYMLVAPNHLGPSGGRTTLLFAGYFRGRYE